MQIKRLSYTVTEASQATSLSIPYLYVLMRKGALRYTLIGRRRLIPVSALMELVEGRSGDTK